MSEVRKYSLLIGGLLRAADMPGLEHRVVPRPSEIEHATAVILNAPIKVAGGQPDPETRLWFEGSDDQDVTAPRRYSVEIPAGVEEAELFSALVRAVLDVTPLPSGIVSDWSIIIALDDGAGKR